MTLPSCVKPGHHGMCAASTCRNGEPRPMITSNNTKPAPAGTTGQRPMNSVARPLRKRQKYCREKKALQGSQDERMKKEKTSPSGKPDLKKQTVQPEGKKSHGDKRKTGPETGQPAVMPETQKGGPAQGGTPVGPGHSGGKSK